ncbi:MAG: LysM peptidoglycan-binding domain-containing protein [Patescibacteria group bacterium]|jgi:LysM repeat protein
MAILEPENVPATSGERQKTHRANILSLVKIFLDPISKICKKLFFVVRSATQIIVQIFTSNRYLPHFAMVAILSLATFSNIGQTVQAKTIENQLVSVDRADGQSIVSTVDQFTPLINGDGHIVEIADSSLASSGGFISSSASVETQLTARVEPDPDNSNETIYYIVKTGDTLSGLGMKFSVKIATIKYLNDITGTNTIKPNQKLKIPEKNYEVSAALIAKKENAEKAKVAAKNAAKVTATAKAQAPAKKQYYGTINGVRYVERSYGQCYTYVVSQGYAVSGHVLAKWIPTNSSTPRAGGLVVTNESWAGHVAIVTSVNDDGTFNLRERNYASGWITERTLRSDDGVIKGFAN